MAKINLLRKPHLYKSGDMWVVIVLRKAEYCTYEGNTVKGAWANYLSSYRPRKTFGSRVNKRKSSHG